MIKRLLRISSQFFVSSVLELSYILSYSCTHRAFLEYSSIGERKAKEGQGKKRTRNEGWIKQLQ